MVVVLLSGALYAGGLIFQDIFSPEGASLTEAGTISPSLLIGILVIAITTGAYSTYGGLTSVVWTDVVQTIILLVAGTFVTITALQQAGGWEAMWEANAHVDENRVHLIQSAFDSFAPWPGMLTLFLTLGVWYKLYQSVLYSTMLRGTHRVGCPNGYCAGWTHQAVFCRSLLWYRG